MGHLPQRLLYEVESARLANCGFNKYSQFGEDGLISELFFLIGETNRSCFEVGAADGHFYSNTLRLREMGWSAVLVESEPKQFSRLTRYETDAVQVVNEKATSMDDILSRCRIEDDPDFGVIDIDGQDYWLWHDMEQFKPRVMLVEFHWANGDEFIPPRSDTDARQAGEMAMRRLAINKGYEIAAKTHVNLLCVRNDCTGWRKNQ